MVSPIPPLLEPYLLLPPETSQIILTSILGASTNWLVLRYLHSLLQAKTSRNASNKGDDDPGPEPNFGPVKVLLVSFLRDFAFWRDGASRLGVDLAGLARRGRFGFVDGLSGLFSGEDGDGSLLGQDARSGSGAGAGPGTGAGAGENGGKDWRWTLTSPSLGHVRRVLEAAIDALRGQLDEEREGPSRVVLVVDQLDFLLAAAGGQGEGDDSISGLRMRELVLDLREQVYATILTLSADEPLIAAQTTTLEKEHASFVLSLAHETELVLGLRLLDTGTAKDVSGVMRITRGGQESEAEVEEHEYLYHVGGDGGVKVFERGQ